MKIIYWKADSTGVYYTEIQVVDEFAIGLYPNECQMIVPEFVRPIHYSIFEDE